VTQIKVKPAFWTNACFMLQAKKRETESAIAKAVHTIFVESTQVSISLTLYEQLFVSYRFFTAF